VVSDLIPRRLTAIVQEALTAFRVVIVNGPRQSGKSTLTTRLVEVAGSTPTVRTLDDRTQLRAARMDPEGFVRDQGGLLIIDEVQRGGEALIRAIKAEVDRNPVPGRFLLSGSSRFLTVPMLSESLAGRARILELWPLSQGERLGQSDGFLERALQDPAAALSADVVGIGRQPLVDAILAGGYPATRSLSDRFRSDWLVDYGRTLMQRDLVELRKVQRVGELPRLLSVLAARTAHEVNLASIGRDTGMSPDSIRQYLDLLQTIYLVHEFPPFSSAFTPRAKRRSKLHFVDSGLAAAVLGLTPSALGGLQQARFGALLESFVASELLKQLSWLQHPARMMHFRDRDGREVDVVIERADGRVVAIEVKASVDVDHSDARGLEFLRNRLGDRFMAGFLLHGGRHRLRFGDRIVALPVSALWEAQ
jgi:hypothetical protein